MALTVPDEYIDTKTGNTHKISSKVEEQIEFHAQNGSLHHFIFSALHDYVSGRRTGNSNQPSHSSFILEELAEIKRMLENGSFLPTDQRISTPLKPKKATSLSLEEVHDILDSFGG